MQWSTWSNCSATCGRGARSRFTLCAENTGAPLISCKELGLDSQDFEHIEECNTWDKSKCASPCIGYKCMDFAACVDTSDDIDPNTACECQLGRIKNEIGDEVTSCFLMLQGANIQTFVSLTPNFGSKISKSFEFSRNFWS